MLGSTDARRHVGRGLLPTLETRHARSPWRRQTGVISSTLRRRPIASARRTAGAVVAAICAMSSCGGGVDEGGLVRSSLDQIPVEAYDIASDASDSFELSIGDLTATADAVGLDAPKVGRDEADVVQWLIDLEVSSPDQANDTGLALLLPRSIEIVQATPDIVKDELGLDLGAIATYAAIEAPIGQFVAFTGDLRLDSGLDDLGGGVVSYGSGSDFELNLEEVSELSGIGRPIRLGERGGGIAVSTSTDAIEAYIADETTLGDDRRFVDIADVLDSAGVVGAYIVERDFSFDGLSGVASGQYLDVLNELNESASGLDNGVEDFDIVGIGMVDRDGEAGNVVVYHFDDSDAAARSVEALEDLWRDGDRFSAGAPISDSVDVMSVEAEGSTVTVALELTSTTSTRLPVDMLVQQEVVFLHG
jgi:hypothetical protein